MLINTCMNDREICPVCEERPVAINCRKGNKTYYRKVCDSCSRKKKKLKPAAPQWYRMGYRKKDRCEKCNFKSKSSKQMFVFHVDGNLSSIDSFNLKTICSNCKIEIYTSRLAWVVSSQIGDF